jgi:Protein of unknown function (DUF4013)
VGPAGSGARMSVESRLMNPAPPPNPYVPPSVAAASPPPAALPGSSLDFGRALGFFFQDPNWVQKLLVGSLFSLLSMFVVGGIFIAGYAVRLIRRTARGEPYPLPEWDDLGGMFTEGLAAFGAYLAHILPAALVFGVVFVPIALLGDRHGDAPPAALFIVVPLALVAMVAFFAILFYFPAALTRLAVEERFSAAFEVGSNWDFLRRNISNYLLAIVVILVAGSLSQFGILLFCIGILPASFWSQCVSAYALGEVALRDPNRAPAAAASPQLPPPIPR